MESGMRPPPPTKQSCLVLLTLLRNSLGVASGRLREYIHSCSQEKVNTVAVSAEPVRKYTAYTQKGKAPVFHS